MSELIITGAKNSCRDQFMLTHSCTDQYEEENRRFGEKATGNANAHGKDE